MQKFALAQLQILLIVCIISCSLKNGKEMSTTSLATDSLTSMTTVIDTVIEEVVIEEPPPIRTHIFKKGETLWALGETYYTQRHYYQFIKLYNHIEDETRITFGSELKVPPLEVMLTDTSMVAPSIQKEMQQLLQARALFVEVDQLLWQLRRNTNFKGRQVLPDTVKQNLLEAATIVESVTTQLLTPREDFVKQPPRDVYGLTALSKNLRSLADGANDGYGYDLDMVHQDWVRATLRIIALAKRSYQNK